MALVLCTGSDPVVMQTRQLMLEKAGHTVVLASNDNQVEKACKSHRFDVAVIGQNVRRRSSSVSSTCFVNSV